MNEQIEKFSEQARQYADSMYPSGLDLAKWGPAYQEKFAELIVKECAEIALTEAQSNGNFDTFNKIVKHFGVEV